LFAKCEKDGKHFYVCLMLLGVVRCLVDLWMRIDGGVRGHFLEDLLENLLVNRASWPGQNLRRKI
jgi:hypothetical protein